MNKIKTLGLAISASVAFPQSVIATENDINAYIIGGNEVQTSPNELSTVYIRFATGGMCSGSIIDNRWILTAAHCIKIEHDDNTVSDVAIDNIKVFTSITHIKDITNANTYNVVDAIAHPGYVPEKVINPYPNDIALLALSRNVENGQIIKYPSLSEADEIENQLAQSIEEPNLVIRGWGKTSQQNQFASDVLMEASAPFYSDQECYDYTNDKKKYQSPWIQSTNDPYKICTSSKINVGMCNGDSGGPLIYTDQSGQKIQVGVSSYSSKDCGDDSPEIYTRVGAFSDWINNVIAEKTPTLPAPVPYEDESTGKDNTDNGAEGGSGGSGSIGSGLIMSLLAMGWLRRKRG
ncbi:S1 family peptidase [Photobacterium leiognathi]|uniref:S1 family peptidase n=1 Tax=Photobacterium leiognathi TaxID=553611 RepID=UPI002738B859|nr:serine protease [Photobacterium leiognathi]